jgi:hypothetical protein
MVADVSPFAHSNGTIFVAVHIAGCVVCATTLAGVLLK